MRRFVVYHPGHARIAWSSSWSNPDEALRVNAELFAWCEQHIDPHCRNWSWSIPPYRMDRIYINIVHEQDAMLLRMVFNEIVTEV